METQVSSLVPALRVIGFSNNNPQSSYLHYPEVTGFHEGTLKWKSQDITKAKTIQASRKFKKRWPCQKFRVSAGGEGPVGGTTEVSFASLHCSVIPTSTAPATLCAIDPQISQVLLIVRVKKVVKSIKKIVDNMSSKKRCINNLCFF